MRILITGGSGFIGSNLAKLLTKKGYEVGILDIIKPTQKNITYQFHNCDILKKIKFMNIASKYDGIIHLAGVLGTAEQIDKPSKAARINILGSLNFLEACKKYAIPGVAITNGNHFMYNTYAITRECAARFAQMYNNEHGTRIIVIRGYHAYGPKQKHKPIRKMLPNFIVNALRKESIVIYGTGNQIADMIYIDDLVKIIVDSLELALNKSKKLPKHILEAGSGYPSTVNDIAKLVNLYCKNPKELRVEKKRRGEDIDAVVLSDPTTLNVLGYKIKKISRNKYPRYVNYHITPLEEGIKKTIQWYKDNYRWQE